MARTKSPRPILTPDKQVITMPETSSAPQIKKNPSAISAMPVNSPAPDLESKIRQRAYEFFVERGYTPGLEQEDWFRAEREVLGSRDSRKQSA